MKRRSFFQSLLKAAAIVALAPRLAFGDPRMPKWVFVQRDCLAYTDNGFVPATISFWMKSDGSVTWL